MIKTLHKLVGSATAKARNAPLPLHGLPGEHCAIPVVDSLADQDLTILNSLLPWNAFVLDGRGRRFGNQFHQAKRNTSQQLPDPRIVNFHQQFDLRGKRVLEMGCFEGIHSASFAMLGADVIAVDSRIEHVCKTIVRCGLMHLQVTPYVWDVETPAPPELDLQCDVLSHIGVLYHLVDPVTHLEQLLPKVRQAVLLDTHVATDDAVLTEYVAGGRTYRYYEYQEAGRAAPFAGMYDHAKWLRLDDLTQILARAGFQTELIEDRNERNGRRVLIHGSRA